MLKDKVVVQVPNNQTTSSICHTAESHRVRRVPLGLKGATEFVLDVVGENSNNLGSITRKELQDFQMFSMDLFEFSDNKIFKTKQLDASEIMERKLRRSTKQEYKRIKDEI